MTFFGRGFQLVVDITHTPQPLLILNADYDSAVFDGLYGAMNNQRSECTNHRSAD